MCDAAARLSGSVRVEGERAALWVGPQTRPWSRDERSTAAIVLLRPLGILAAEMGGAPTAAQYETDEGIALETGALPAVVTAVAIGVLGTAVVGYVAYQAAQVIDRHLQRRTEFAALLAEQEHVRALVADHTDREQAAGQTLPFSSALTGALDAAERRQKNLLRKRPDIDSGFPGVTIGGVSWGIVGAVVGVAGAAYLLMSE